MVVNVASLPSEEALAILLVVERGRRRSAFVVVTFPSREEEEEDEEEEDDETVALKEERRATREEDNDRDDAIVIRGCCSYLFNSLCLSVSRAGKYSRRVNVVASSVSIREHKKCLGFRCETLNSISLEREFV